MIARHVCLRCFDNKQQQQIISKLEYAQLRAYYDAATVKHNVPGFATHIVTTLKAQSGSRMIADCMNEFHGFFDASKPIVRASYAPIIEPLNKRVCYTLTKGSIRDQLRARGAN